MMKLIQVNLNEDPAQPDGDEIATTEQLLSSRQQIAMLSLLAGDSQRVAARRAGVREETVSRWVNCDDEFMTLYALRRADVWKAFEAQVAALIPLAFGALIDLMRNEDYHRDEVYSPHARLGAVQTALKMAGLLPTGTRVTAFGGGQVNVADRQVNITRGAESVADLSPTKNKGASTL